MMHPGSWFLRERLTGAAASRYYPDRRDAEAALGHSEGLGVERDWVIETWSMDVDRRLGARRRLPPDPLWERIVAEQIEQLMAECDNTARWRGIPALPAHTAG